MKVNNRRNCKIQNPSNILTVLEKTECFHRCHAHLLTFLHIDFIIKIFNSNRSRDNSASEVISSGSDGRGSISGQGHGISLRYPVKTGSGVQPASSNVNSTTYAK
jgi:hypothetical protein